MIDALPALVVAGVLTATHVQGADVQTVVLGMGVNVALAPQVESTPFVPRTGSLHAAGIEDDLGRFFWAALDALAIRYDQLMAPGGNAALLEAYRGESLIIGRSIRIWEDDAALTGDPAGWPEPLAAGLVRSIENDLSLRLTGLYEPVHKGRLALESACRDIAERSKPKS